MYAPPYSPPYHCKPRGWVSSSAQATVGHTGCAHHRKTDRPRFKCGTTSRTDLRSTGRQRTLLEGGCRARQRQRPRPRAAQGAHARAPLSMRRPLAATGSPETQKDGEHSCATVSLAKTVLRCTCLIITSHYHTRFTGGLVCNLKPSDESYCAKSACQSAGDSCRRDCIDSLSDSKPPSP
jgi:hypothetical protein